MSDPLGTQPVARSHGAEHPEAVGTALVAHVLATATELNTKAACHAVVVTALHAQARSWWERLGFYPFHPDEPTDADLNLLTSEIEGTLDGLER